MRQSSGAVVLAALLIGLAPVASFAQTNVAAAPEGSRDYNAIERDFIAKNPKLARRTGDTLHLKLHDGTETDIVDSPKCAEVEDLLSCNNHKSVVFFYKEPGIYLVHVTLLKGARFMLVDDAVGEPHILAGAPIWGPDKVSFATVSQSPDDPSSLNGFEVWSIADGQIARKLSYQLPFSGTVEFDHWEDAGLFTLHVRHANEDQAQYQASWLDVKLSDDGVAVESRWESN